ncbi:MAG: sugar-binding protein [Succinivibrio sp.]|nr:sugar-binding protein [Succinivibrio sp.]
MSYARSLIAVTVTALALSSSPAFAFKVGIALPTQEQERYFVEGPQLLQALKSKGFEADLFYGGEGVNEIQLRQIPRMIKEGCNVIVLCAIDGEAFGEVLKEAKQKNVKIISYDHLVMNSDAVTYYVAYDNEKVGEAQGRYIEQALHLADGNSGYRIEVFAGAMDDNNSHFFLDGAMKVLKPYIDNGQVTIPSGQTKLEEVNIVNWSTENALKRMDSLVQSQGYGPDKGRLDAVLSPNDTIGIGIVKSLKKAGYTPQNFPVVTGQDGETAAIAAIDEGYMGMTVFKDPVKLVDRVVTMVSEISSGGTVEINDNHTYNNGAKVVDAYLVTPTVVDRSNLKQIMLDSGKITKEQLQNAKNSL